MTVTTFSELRESSLASSVSTRHLNTYPIFTKSDLFNEFNRKMDYQQALLVSRKRESQIGQAPIVPDGFSLPFPWNIIFAIYIVKNGYCKFCSRNLFYSIQVPAL